MNRKTKLLIWEIACIFWIALAGSLLHFMFELTNYMRSVAVFAAVNESIWEHSKMYFWPGLAYALAQYTYTREYHNNYWFGKAMAMAVTPVTIVLIYQSYMGYSNLVGVKPSLGIMLGIMFAGITAGQLTSYKILSADPMPATSPRRRLALPGIAAMVAMFSLFTYFPPKLFIFENFACYQYTGEYGILDDYEPYRVFVRIDKNGMAQEGAGVNYCGRLRQVEVPATARNRSRNLPLSGSQTHTAVNE